MFYTIIVPLLLYCLCFKAYCFLIKLEHITSCEKSRCVHYHKGYCPKHQHRYHLSKARMKRKKRRKFQKPKPLFHLTLCSRMLIACIIFAIRVQWFFNCMATSIFNFCQVTHYLTFYLCPAVIGGKSYRAKHWLKLLLACIHSIYDHLYFKVIDIFFGPTDPPSFESSTRHVGFASSTISDCAIQQSRFDTDSFKIGIDT